MRKLLAVLAVGFAFGAIAAATVTRTLTSAGSMIDHGDWVYFNPSRGGDGGFRFTVYGVAPIQEDGGTEFNLTPTVCEPGAWNAATTVCVNQWRAANGL